MTDAELPIQVAGPDEWDDIAALLSAAFLAPLDPDAREHDRAVFEPERSLLVRDDDAVVAHAAAFTRELSVPGGVLPAAHVTMVGVAATHRRRRLLTRMMHRQLREVRDAGREPVAVLWASEGRIYQRFGYGLAAQRLIIDADVREVRLPAGTTGGRLRVGNPEALRPELAAVYDRVRADRPGWSSRDDRWWRFVLADYPSRRGGAAELRAVLHEGPAGVDGYALYRTRSKWDSSPLGVVEVAEITATGPESYGRLWRFLMSIDLTRTVTHHFAATDEPVLHLVDEPRQLGARIADALWVRLVDLPAALASRRYVAPVDTVLEITDPLLPENAGRWRLTGDADGARCVPTRDPAELAGDVRDLGAAYLGGSSLGALAAAGRIRELRPGALQRVNAAFGWLRAPVGVEVF